MKEFIKDLANLTVEDVVDYVKTSNFWAVIGYGCILGFVIKKL